MSSCAFAAALSEHPDPAQAVAEVSGAVIECLGAGGPPPELAVLFVTARHLRSLADIAATVRTRLRPATLIGCAAETVVGAHREVEGGNGVSLWAGRTGPVVPFQLRVERTPDGPTLVGWPDIADDASGLLVLGDPFTFPADEALKIVDQSHPGLAVVGGMASAARAPGGNRLVLDDQVLGAGAVGVVLGPGVRVETVVSQGCRPVGTPLVVTRADGNVVYELGGRPALERLGEVAEGLAEPDRQLLTNALHFGRVIDEHKDEFGRGDFLIRNVMGGDRESGAIAVADMVDVGSTAQYQVRDAATADEDLRQLLSGHSAGGALLFTCNGRGSHMFGTADHDATVVTDSLAGAPVAGMSCAGELGPVGGRNFLHGFTASVVLLSQAGG